jgi:uncharacterized SAM-binding protein YcdF (DUF218 family)
MTQNPSREETSHGGLRGSRLVWLRGYLLTTGAVTTLFLIWILSPLPLWVDIPLIQNDTPVRSFAIVCLGSGSENGLPSSSGWQRIRTSVALFRDGFAPIVIFTGYSGAGPRSVAEIYAEAAAWIGLPPKAVRLEPKARNTHEHPIRLLSMDLGNPSPLKSTALLLVTSPYSARRARLVFQKAGFTGIRVVTSYGELDPDSHFESSGGQGLRLMTRISRVIVAAWEWAALAYYKAHGWI